MSSDPRTFPYFFRRILWGKAVNCGMTCIAPDYVLVSEKSQDKLIEEFKKAAEEFWPASKGGIVESDDYGKIVNDAHWRRLNSMLGGTKGEIVMGEAGDENKKFMPPTLVKLKGDCRFRNKWGRVASNETCFLTLKHINFRRSI